MKKFIQRAAVVMLAAGLILSTAATAPATTWTVTSPAGYGAGTLRDAIDSAQNGDTIVFDPGLDGETIEIWTNNPYSSSALSLAINVDLTIVGPGASNLAISGGQFLRVFSIFGSAQVTISGLTIEDGGGIFGSFDPQLDDEFGGAILSFGDLTLLDCVVSGNTAGDSAGGIGNIGTGGGIANFGTMTLDHCTVADNDSSDGGGLYNAGAMVISNSTVTGNSAEFYGGGIYNDTAGTLLIVSSNVSGNQSGKGKDIYNLGKLTTRKK